VGVRHLTLHHVCRISNLRLGVCPSLTEHPLARLHGRGVAITVNADVEATFRAELDRLKR
jgi:adenosine deaminase